MDTGDKFRLLFVSTVRTTSTVLSIQYYNTLAVTNTQIGHRALRPYAMHFRALVSTAGSGGVSGVNARDNTQTQGAGTGIPIYWVNGAKVADSYTDFYDGTWDSTASTAPSGRRSTARTLWTGSNADGTARTGLELGNVSGNAEAGVGSLDSAASTISAGTRSVWRSLNIYGLSPEFVVSEPPRELTITGGSAVTEGGNASFTITADTAPSSNLTVTVSVADAADSNFLATASEGTQTFTFTGGVKSATYTVPTVGDSTNEPDGVITVTLQDGTGYTVGSPSSAGVTVEDDDGPELTITGGAAVTEGGTASYTITADVAPTEALTVSLSVADAASPSDFVAAGDEGADTVTLGMGATNVTFTVATVNDTGGTADEPDGEVTVTLQAGAGYTVGTASSASVAVSDNDATTVTLEGVAVNLPEGSSLEFSVRLNRELVAGEALPVPVTFGGGASLAEHSVSCPSTSMLPQGVTCANLGTATATVTFTGPSAKLVDLTVTATVDSDAESAESVAIGLGTLNANSGTGLSGGATGVDNLADFNIVDAIGVALAFTAESSSVNEGTMNAVAQFSAYVQSGVVPAGGVVIPFTVNTGTAQAGDASTADYGTVPAGITIAAGAASGTADLPIVDDLEDELTERIRFLVGELPPGYTFHGGSFDAAASDVLIVDDDETEISLTGGGTITEQDTTTTATLTVRASRRLLSDPRRIPPVETLTVPLVLATTTGAALPGSASPLFAVTASGTGVVLSGANSATPTLTFTGHNTNTVQTATVTITATANGDADSTAETVTATLGNMTAQMDGGVIATTANSATLTVADNDAPPQLSVSLVGTDLRQVSVSEGETATIRVRRDGGDTSAALTFSATATDADGFSGTFTAVTSIPAGQRSVDITYSVAEDTADAPRGEATYVLSTGSGYTVSSTAGSVSLVVVDNDPTEVSMFESGAFELQEGDRGIVVVSLGRGLVSGEVLVVPLTIAGTATRGTDYTLSATPRNNVTYQNLNKGSASVTYTGPTSRSVSILLHTVVDDVVEATAETVDIGPGPLNENSGTGLDGGALGVDRPNVFTIEDLAANTVSLSVSDDGEAAEGDDALTITATLDRANDSGSAISIPIQVASTGTTAQASDYTVASSISIADEARSGTTSFTVTDDQVAEAPETVLVELGSALPLDIVSGEDSDVGIAITDNDTPGLVFSPTSLGVAEGDDASYTVRLATEPTSTVTVTITGHSGTDLTLDATSLEFTTSTWDDAQTVTVTAGEDADTTDDTATLAHAASGGGYGAVDADLAVTVTDNDSAGLVLSPTSLDVDEGDDASYTVRLATEPTGTVTVTVSGHSGTDLTLDATSLEFTTSTWEDEQTVTVTAAEDDDTADDTATLAHAAAGGGYSLSANLAVTVTDDDTAGLVFSPTSLDVDEGDDASYTVKLATEPTSTVTVTITGHSGTDLTLDVTSLEFTTSTWDDAQTVTVTAGEDADTTDDTATLAHAASGGGYGAVDADLAVTVTDNDSAGLVLSPTSLDVDEGDDASYTVRLATEPTGTVTVTITVPAGTDLTLDATSLEFTTSTWEDEQTVTVTAAEDDDTADDTATLAHAAAGGGYSLSANLAVTVTDDDTAGLVFSPTSLDVDEGDDASYTVKLATEPTGTVTVTVSGHSGTDLTLDETSLEFTTSTWEDEQTVTVTAAEDDDTADDTATLAHAAAGGGYSLSANLAVTVTDNDTLPVVSFALPSSSAGEDAGTRNVTVNLSPAPTAATTTVSYTVGGNATAGSDFSISGSGTLSVASGATTATIPVAITDDAAEENSETVLLTLTAGSGYTVGSANTHTLTITDDDGTGPPTPSVSLSASPNPVTEGSAVTVTARLSAALAGSVTIPLVLTAGTAESGDYGALGSIMVAGGQTTGTGVITTAQDADEDDETFTVALGNLPPEVTPGSPSSIEVAIRDDDGTEPPMTPTVSLSVAPNPVDEGNSVTVTARLSETLAGSVTIPLMLTTGTAEAGDFGALGSITVSGGQTTGTGTVSTAQDDDEADETFTVALGNLPSDVTPGSPSSVLVTIRDDDGTTPPANRPPTVTASCDPCEVSRGGEVSLTATASDPDGDSLTYEWSAPAGRFSEATDAATTRWTAPDEVGSVTIRVDVSDRRGGTASAEVTVDVANRSPSVSAWCDPCEVSRGGEVSLTATASDPDGDSLTYEWSAPAGRFSEATDAATTRWTAPDEVGSVTIRVDVSDRRGGTASAEVTVDVANRSPDVSAWCDPCEVSRGGEVSLTATASDPDGDSLTYEWSAPAGRFSEATDAATTRWTAPDEVGSVTIRVDVSDGRGGTASAEVTVDVANRSPSVSAWCDPCEIHRGGEVQLTATASDPDGDGLTYDWSAPAGRFSEATDAATTRWTAPDEIGPVTIRVDVSDGQGGTASAEVTVDVANRSPTVTASCDPCEIHRGGEVSLTATASDPDGDELAYAWSAAAGSFSEAADAATARWTAPGTTGVVTIEVEVSDGHGGTASAEVIVEVANRPPVFESSEYALELRENVDGRRRPVDLGAVTASDPDGDELIYDLASGDGSRFKAGGRDGVVRYAGPGEDFESEPNRYELAVRARDTYGAEAEARVVVTVVNVNEAPEAADDEAVTDEDEALTVDVLANDTDPDGDDLRVESVSAPAHGTTRVASDGGVTYTPAANYHGVDRFTYVVSDPDGLTAEAAVEVTVLSVNDPPEAEDDEATTDEDEALTVDVLANDTDPDGDSLRVESVSAPAHGTTGVASDGGVTYTPAANYHGVDRFTYVVSDPDGLTAEAAVEVMVLSVNDPPVTVGVIPDQPLHEGGGSVDLDLAPFFDDIDGDPLTYRAVSSDTDVATTSVAGTVLTLTPVVYGSAMVRVTAEDPEGLTATQTFTVGVDDRLVRAVMSDTLAAMARSHLASARMTLGRRVEAGAGEESRLTVMGRAVPLGGASARRAAEQLVAGWLSSIAWSGGASAQGPGDLFGPAGMSPGFGAYPAGGLGGPGGGFGDPGGGLGGPAMGGPAALGMPPVSSGGLLYGLGGFGGGSETLLRGTEFELALGGDEDGRARAGRRWSVWGQGDIQTFRGAPTLLGYDARYDGDVRTGYVGVDAQLTRRWLAGVAVSRSGGRGDWEVGSARGRLRTTLTALHPYAQWSNGTTSVWTTAGGGWGEGEAENVREATGRVGASGLGLRLGLVELRRRVGAVGGGAELGLRADAAWAELRTGEGRESVDRLTAAVNQQRVGAEVSRPVRLGALALAPFGEAHLRRDEGGGQNGLGMEVAFGLGLTSGIVRLDVQGRTLAVHSAAGYGERGAGLTLTVGGRQREGLSLSVSPSWGDAAAGTGTLWQEEVYRQYLSEEEQDAFAVDARGDYGMRLPNGALLNWFGSYSHSPYGRSFLIGGSIGGLADALLPGR